MAEYRLIISDETSYAQAKGPDGMRKPVKDDILENDDENVTSEYMDLGITGSLVGRALGKPNIDIKASKSEIAFLKEQFKIIKSSKTTTRSSQPLARDIERDYMSQEKKIYSAGIKSIKKDIAYERLKYTTDILYKNEKAIKTGIVMATQMGLSAAQQIHTGVIANEGNSAYQQRVAAGYSLANEGLGIITNTAIAGVISGGWLAVPTLVYQGAQTALKYGMENRIRKEKQDISNVETSLMLNRAGNQSDFFNRR